jgi:hypothetical protein
MPGAPGRNRVRASKFGTVSFQLLTRRAPSGLSPAVIARLG